MHAPAVRLAGTATRKLFFFSICDEYSSQYMTEISDVLVHCAPAWYAQYKNTRSHGGTVLLSVSWYVPSDRKCDRACQRTRQLLAQFWQIFYSQGDRLEETSSHPRMTHYFLSSAIYDLSCINASYTFSLTHSNPCILDRSMSPIVTNLRRYLW